MASASTVRAREIPVHIKVDPVTGDISVVPNKFRISKNQFQEVQWTCDYDFVVSFNKNGSPFYESQFDQDNPCSGLPLRIGTGDGDARPYDYSVTVGNRTLDPQGVVDP